MRQKKKQPKNKVIAPCEDRTHDLQISDADYETDRAAYCANEALTRYWSLHLICISNFMSSRVTGKFAKLK